MDRRLTRPPRTLAANARTLTMMLVVTALAACSNPSTGPLSESITINGETFVVEVARDPAAREQGLMHREEVPADGGMLFIFPNAEQRAFWMGNCLVDIDIAFIDAGGRVTAIHTMKAESPRRTDETEADYRRRLPEYPSGYPAQFALELKAGSLDRLNVRIEDKITLDLDRLKGLAK
jgi:uncharacterized membrane protein (UPF0127 family)